MTLYEILGRANKSITPDSNLFYFYTLKTSDDNGGFLRTCYREKRRILKNKIVENIGFVVIGSTQPITEESLLKCFTRTGIRTDVKLQIYYGLISSADEAIELNESDGYIYNKVVKFDGTE